YGKKKYKTKDGTWEPAVQVVFTWMIMPQHWDAIEFVQIDQKDIKEQLKLDVNKKHFSPDELLSKEQLQILFSELKAQREAKAKLNTFFLAVERLESQLTIYKEIVQRFLPGFIPLSESDTCLPLKDFPEDYADLCI